MRADLTADDLTLDWPESFADTPRGHAEHGTGAGRAIGSADGSRPEADADGVTPSANRLPLSALLRGLGALVVVGAFVLGIAVTLLGLGFGAELVLARFTAGTWTALVLLGSASIMAGSLLERHGAAVGALLARRRRRFDAAR
jgi:hypothetical protein